MFREARGTSDGEASVQYSPLKFICPVNGKQVDTDIDLDEDSFASLHDATELGCPHCTDTHRLDNVQSWLGDTISSMRVASSLAAKPPNTMECTAPIRAQASIAIAASGTIGI